MNEFMHFQGAGVISTKTERISIDVYILRMNLSQDSIRNLTQIWTKLGLGLRKCPDRMPSSFKLNSFIFLSFNHKTNLKQMLA